MQITKKELEERQQHPNNLFGEKSSFTIVRPKAPGNKQSSTKRDIEHQSTIGALARIAPRDLVADITGTSPAQVANLANGRPSGYNEGATQDEELLHKINQKLGRASDTAIDKLQAALGLISQEKLLNSKARELSAIAKDMATIADKARPVLKDENTRAPHIVFYAPRFHKEDFYDVVEVKSSR